MKTDKAIANPNKPTNTLVIRSPAVANVSVLSYKSLPKSSILLIKSYPEFTPSYILLAKSSSLKGIEAYLIPSINPCN